LDAFSLPLLVYREMTTSTATAGGRLCCLMAFSFASGVAIFSSEMEEGAHSHGGQ